MSRRHVPAAIGSPGTRFAALFATLEFCNRNNSMPLTKEPLMLNRVFAVGLTFVAYIVLAAAMRANEPQLQKGTVVSASATRLVMKDSMGKEQSFTIDHTTKVTVNGQPGKLEDLQETMPIQVALDEKGKVLAVSTIDKDKVPVLAASGHRGFVPRTSEA